MLLFHGTRGDRRLVDSITREGLRGFERGWTHERFGGDAFTFLANTPVSGHGGDPVAFAMGFRLWKGPRTPGDGWIIVVDLPHEAQGLIRAVVPNRALEDYFAARTLQDWLVHTMQRLDAGGVLPWREGGPLLVEVLEEIGRRDDLPSIARGLRPVLLSKVDDLTSERFTFGGWCRYAEALRAAKSIGDVVRAGRKWGFTWKRPEVPHCALCVQGLANWVYAIDAPLACADGGGVAVPASMAGRDVLGYELAPLARLVARAYAGASPDAVRAAFVRLRTQGRSATWGRLLAQTPIDEQALPAPWRTDFGRGRAEDGKPGDADLRARDVQLVCDPIPPERIVGALRIAAGARLRPWARPSRGETLEGRLWHAARALAARRKGTAVIYDG
ncbi:MAG: hypothetical protein QM820_22265 [Minicystis sp.]